MTTTQYRAGKYWLAPQHHANEYAALEWPREQNEPGEAGRAASASLVRPPLLTCASITPKIFPRPLGNCHNVTRDTSFRNLPKYPKLAQWTRSGTLGAVGGGEAVAVLPGAAAVAAEAEGSFT